MDKHYNLLLVDDHMAHRATLAEQLEFHDNFTVTQAETAIKGLFTAISGKFDRIILERNMLDLDGFEFCRKIRLAHIKTPIIMLSAHDDDNITHSSPFGPNDFIPKPFRLGILLAKIRGQI